MGESSIILWHVFIFFQVCQISGISGTQSDIGGAHSAQFNYDEGSDTLTVTYTEGGGGIVQ